MDAKPSPLEENFVQITRAEKELSKLAQDATRDASDRRAKAAELDFSAVRTVPLSGDATPSAIKGVVNPISTDRPSLGRRTMQGLARFLLAACIGVAATLAWQWHGEAAKQMAAGWVPQLFGQSSSLSVTEPVSSPSTTAEHPNTPAPEVIAADTAPTQSPAVAQVPTNTLVPAADATPPTELTHLVDAVARDVASMRQEVASVRQEMERLAAKNDQLARNMAKLQGSRREIQQRLSATEAHMASASAPKPASIPPPPQAGPQVSSAPVAAGLPPPPRPPATVR